MISGLGVKLEQRTIALPNQVAIREAHAINFRAGALCISRGSNQYRTRAALCSSSLGIEQRKASQGVGCGTDKITTYLRQRMDCALTHQAHQIEYIRRIKYTPILQLELQNYRTTRRQTYIKQPRKLIRL